MPAPLLLEIADAILLPVVCAIRSLAISAMFAALPLAISPAPLARSPTLRAGFLGGDDFPLVAVEGVRYRGFFRGSALDEHAAHHLVLGAPGPVLGVALRAERLGDGRPANAPDVAFQVPEGVFVSAAMVLLRKVCTAYCTEFAPRGAGKRKGLAAKPQSP